MPIAYQAIAMFANVVENRLNFIGVFSSTIAQVQCQVEIGLHGFNNAQAGGLFAVSLCDDDESNIRPSKTLVLGSAPLTGESQATDVTQPLWPWLLIGVLLILTLEWIIYNKRVWV